MGFTVTIESDVLEDWLECVDHIGQGLRDGIIAGLNAGVAEAKAVHRYKDQTGTLTESIGGIVTGGDATHAFGELYAGAPYASFLEYGTRPHIIERKQAPMLAWEEQFGDWHYAKLVHHPGTQPRTFMVWGELKAEEVATATIQAAVDAACSKMSQAA